MIICSGKLTLMPDRTCRCGHHWEDHIENATIASPGIVRCCTRCPCGDFLLNDDTPTPTLLPPEITLPFQTPFDALDILAKKCWEISESKGFHEPSEREDGIVRDASPVERMMLIVSEVSEMMEAYRDDKAADSYRQERDKRGFWKPEGVASELADTVIRCFDYAHNHGVPLGQVVKEKMEYNQTRPHKHGGRTI